MAVAPLQAIDPRRYGDAALARHLLTLRGEQWIGGEETGDPYALLLRGREPASVFPRLWELPDVHRSTTGAWVTARQATASAALADPRLGPGPAGQALVVVPGLLDRDAPPPVPGPDPAWVARRCRELVDAAGAGETEVLSALARPLARDCVRELLGLTPQEAEAAPEGLVDARLCPPPLRAARALVAAVDAVRGRLTGPGELALWALGVDTAVRVMAHALALRLEAGAPLADPAAAVDEVLRLEPPVRFETRVARAPLTLGGAGIEAGEQLVIAVQAAGRDPRVHVEPDAFRPGRQTRGNAPRPPWGAAVDAYVPMARLLAVALLAELDRAFPRSRPVEPLVRRCRAPVTGGPVRLRAVLSR
ncbi:cytochrome P450 [Streptomyces aurantiacus]|uniref:cytochrome P450 n=1 Tax=Streptomyces aurantiacus TaxID=47760 RepID=UPI00331ECDAA